MQTFRITRHLEAVCESEGTRYGFRHLANLLRDGYTIGTAKACYYNRTWESFTFQSVLQGLQSKAAGRLSTYEARKFTQVCKTGNRHEDRALHTVAMIAKLGDIFGSTTKESNDWKARMLKAGLQDKGLIMPEDWDTLDENTKQARLDGAIEAIK